MESSDWAAWVQAIGSIIAILATYFIGERQGQKSIEAVREADSLAEKRQNEFIIGMSQAADHIAQQCHVIFHDGGFVGGQMEAPQLDVSLSLLNIGLNGVPLHQVGSRAAITAVIQLRTACGKLEKALQRAKEHVYNNLPAVASTNWFNFEVAEIYYASNDIRQANTDLVLALTSP